MIEDKPLPSIEDLRREGRLFFPVSWQGFLDSRNVIDEIWLADADVEVIKDPEEDIADHDT